MSIQTVGEAALLVAIWLFVVGVIGGATRRVVAFGAVATALGCAALALLGVAAVVGPAVTLQAGDVLGFLPLDLRFDPLAGTFLVALGVLGVAASVFSIG